MKCNGFGLCGLPQYFNSPIETVAQAVGMSRSCFKKLCRRLGVSRWPVRKLLSLDKIRDTLLQQDLPQDIKEVRACPTCVPRVRALPMCALIVLVRSLWRL